MHDNRSNRSYCFVPGCNSGYRTDRKRRKAEGKKVASLFGPSPGYLELWKKAIPRADKEYTKKHAVCELHFPPGCIERFYTTKFPDGTVFKMARGNPTLKAGSIPSIFPNDPRPSAKLNLKKRKVVAVSKNHKHVTKGSTDQSSTNFSDMNMFPKQKQLSEASNQQNLTAYTGIKEEIDLEDEASSLSVAITRGNCTPKILESSVMSVSRDLSHSPGCVKIKNPLVNEQNSEITHSKDVKPSNNNDLSTITSSISMQIENSNMTITSTKQLPQVVKIKNPSAKEVYILNVNKANSAAVSKSYIPDEETVSRAFNEIAVLTIYPSHEQFLKKTAKKITDLDAKERTDQKILECSNESSVCEMDAVYVPIEDEAVKTFCFDELRGNLDKIDKPNLWWSVTSHCGFIACVQWDEKNYTAEKKVIITENLNIEVFFKDKEVNPMVESPTSIAHISAILKNINSYGVCTLVKEVSNCEIMLPPLPMVRGRKRYLCDVCRDYQRKKYNAIRYQNLARKSKKEKKDWHHRFINESQKVECLQKKVEQLKRQLEIEKNCTAAALEFINSELL